LSASSLTRPSQVYFRKIKCFAPRPGVGTCRGIRYAGSSPARLRVHQLFENNKSARIHWICQNGLHQFQIFLARYCGCRRVELGQSHKAALSGRFHCLQRPASPYPEHGAFNQNNGFQLGLPNQLNYVSPAVSACPLIMHFNESKQIVRRSRKVPDLQPKEYLHSRCLVS